MSLKRGVLNLVGRRIEGVIVKEADRSPCTQLFLVLDGAEYYELYSDSGDLHGIGAPAPGRFADVLAKRPEADNLMQRETTTEA